MQPIAIISHPDCLRHNTGPAHPESAARLSSILEALKNCGFSESLAFLEAQLASVREILRVHSRSYLNLIENTAHDLRGGAAYLDQDTVFSHGSLLAALRAAGAGCQAVDGVIKGEYASAFCAVRPPGHHALPDRAMGFCIFNNIAIAATHALEKHGLERVAIIDFDVHHGNGTQETFEDNPKVLYISTHEWLHYPGTGQANEKGMGNILNLPLPAGTGGEEYRKVFLASAIPALNEYKPQILLVSAGFDGHKYDPLANFMLTENDYEWIGGQINAVARAYCGGKVVSLLEGGYNPQALAASVVSYLGAFRM